MRFTSPLAMSAAALLAATAFAPAEAATTPSGSILGTVSFSAGATDLSAAAKRTLGGWSSSLKQATAVTVEGYGGTTAVRKSTATTLGLARAKAVQSWLAANRAGGTVTVVNRVHASTAGADKGNRVVIIVTKRNLTVTVTSDYDAPPAGQSAVCNFTVSAVRATQGGTQVATSSSGSAAGTCARNFTLKSVPTGKSTTFAVSFRCNESGDYTPADEVCTYAVASSPWSKVALASGDAPENGATTLSGVTVKATTGSVTGARVKFDPK